jgi:hypothetical protein
MARKLRTKKQPKIVRMQPPGMFAPLEEPKLDPTALARRLASPEGDEDGLRRFLGPSNALTTRLHQIKSNEDKEQGDL